MSKYKEYGWHEAGEDSNAFVTLMKNYTVTLRPRSSLAWEMKRNFVPGGLPNTSLHINEVKYDGIRLRISRQTVADPYIILIEVKKLELTVFVDVHQHFKIVWCPRNQPRKASTVQRDFIKGLVRCVCDQKKDFVKLQRKFLDEAPWRRLNGLRLDQALLKMKMYGWYSPVMTHRIYHEQKKEPSLLRQKKEREAREQEQEQGQLYDTSSEEASSDDSSESAVESDSDSDSNSEDPEE